MAHKLKCSGMQNMLNGLLRYRAKLRPELEGKFQALTNNQKPHNLLITCVDSRIVASRVVQTDPGETFLARNPGNLIPNYNVLSPKTPRPEEAALELALVHYKVDTVALSGHSDCKAMNLVYDNRNTLNDKPKNEKQSILKSWLMANAGPSIAKYAQYERSGFKDKLTFSFNDNYKFEAYIDPENEYANHDKFSQINTLVQLENLKQYSFVKDLMDKKKINIYAMWLDIYCGDIFVFSYKEKRFIRLNEETYKQLASDDLI